jgi:hypothetical protein
MKGQIALKSHPYTIFEDYLYHEGKDGARWSCREGGCSNHPFQIPSRHFWKKFCKKNHYEEDFAQWVSLANPFQGCKGVLPIL